MERVRPSARKRALLLGLAFMCALLFTALGAWQVQRRAWKLALIAAVEERIHAPPIAAPSPAAWRPTEATENAYRHVRVHGRFLRGRETLVQALTEDGAGFWVLTPLLTREGFIVLVNRGFLPAARAPQRGQPRSDRDGGIVVTGLLRVSEPRGGFLRSNDPSADRWFSRDVQAIAAKRGLRHVAPYFIDEEAAPGPGWPRGGMTVVRFPNNHLIYSLTWFTLALLSLAGFILVLLSDRHLDGDEPSR